MAIARLGPNNEIVEVRTDIDLTDVPPHKRSQWRVIIDEPPVPPVTYSHAVRKGVEYKNGRPEWVYELVYENVERLIYNETLKRFAKDIGSFNHSSATINTIYFTLDRKGVNRTAEEEDLFNKIIEVQDWITQMALVKGNLKKVKAENYDQDGHWPSPPASLEDIKYLIKDD